MRNQTFHNPVIKGGYPDSSICRAKSTIWWHPPSVIFRSWDLVHWNQIGNGISRQEQIDFKNCDSSEGLWAATIRYDNGTFYIINTLDVEGRPYRCNFIITAKDPVGEWSDAVIIQGAGSKYYKSKGVFMIKYDKLWETMKKKGITQYNLTKDYNISKSLLHRLRNNEGISMNSINTFCNILDCNIEDIATHYKD